MRRLGSSVSAVFCLALASGVTTMSPAGALAQQPPGQPGGSLPNLSLPGAPMPSASLPGGSQPGTAAPQAPAARPVSTGTFSIQNEKAQIKCIHKVQIAAQSDGLLEQLMVDEGASVKKGDLLVKIDERLAKAELGVAMKEAEAAAAQAKQDANLRFSRKVSEVSDAEYVEWDELYRRNSASFQEVRRKALEAQKARLGIEVAEVDHQKDKLTAEVAKEKVNAAQVQMELRTVVAPYDGIIVERLRDQGEWVKQGEPILRLVHLNEMRVEARVRLGSVAAMQLQQAPIRVRVNVGGREQTFESQIEYVSPEVELGSCRIWTKVPNAFVGGSWMLSDGLEATVDIAPRTMP